MVETQQQQSPARTGSGDVLPANDLAGHGSDISVTSISGFRAFEMRTAVNEDHISALAKRVGHNSSIIDELNKEAARELASLRQNLIAYAEKTASIDSLKALQARVRLQDEHIGHMRQEIDRLAGIITETLRMTRDRADGREGWEDGRTIAIQQLESRMRRVEDQLAKSAAQRQRQESERKAYDNRLHERTERKTEILQDEVRKLRDQLQQAITLFRESWKQIK